MVQSGVLKAILWSNNSNKAQTTFSSVTPNTSYKMAGAIKLNDVQFALDGSTGLVDTSASIDSAITLLIGNQTQNALVGAINIKSIKYYPRRLSSAQLQELTT